MRIPSNSAGKCELSYTSRRDFRIRMNAPDEGFCLTSSSDRMTGVRRLRLSRDDERHSYRPDEAAIDEFFGNHHDDPRSKRKVRPASIQRHARWLTGDQIPINARCRGNDAFPLRVVVSVQAWRGSSVYLQRRIGARAPTRRKPFIAASGSATK